MRRYSIVTNVEEEERLGKPMKICSGYSVYCESTLLKTFRWLPNATVFVEEQKRLEKT